MALAPGDDRTQEDDPSPATEQPLAPPFDVVFGDRATAAWAFDFFAETVARLGGGPDDRRFVLSLPRRRTALRLSAGSRLVVGLAARAGVLQMTALIALMESAYPFRRGAPFAGGDDSMAVFTIPLDVARAMPEELRHIYEESMAAVAERFGHYVSSPLRRFHQPALFQALFDKAERERLLAEGLPATSGEEMVGGEAGRPRRPRRLVLGEARPQWRAGEPPRAEPYSRADFLAQTTLTEETADELHDLLLEKRQIILYGPPGTGKTYVARHLGRWLTGLATPPPERLTLIQFHPAYSYEEFMEGIRPETVEWGGRQTISYPTRPGAFVRFCRAAAHVAGPCVFIIDEINRGNVARIFGELMLLLEYREEAIPLPYSGAYFRIPPNVYVIGTMNTADRSIALVDFALRRRFHFFRFGADPDLLDRWLAAHPAAPPYLGPLYRRLANEAIDDPDYAIGPSLFMRALDEATLARLWRRSVLPYLEEYYVDQPARVERWQWEGELVRGLRQRYGGSAGS